MITNPATISRRKILHAIGASAAAAAASAVSGCDGRNQPNRAMNDSNQRATRMPVLFIGHGTPMNAIQDNRWSRAFRDIGKNLPRPRAVLVVSAHWWTEGSFLTGGTSHRTIHDFGNFPPALFEVQYPAPGNPDLAARVTTLLADATRPRASVRDDWGLDHGSWSVLRHLLPAADVPVVQLSLDARLPGERHLELARALHQLRGDGVLVLGSGNVTHNLADAMQRATHGDDTTPSWAEQFDREITQALGDRDSAHLTRAWPDGEHARQAHPHPDHWFPLLYAYGATDAHDTVSFPITGFDLGSLSMRAVRWG